MVLKDLISGLNLIKQLKNVNLHTVRRLSLLTQHEKEIISHKRKSLRRNSLLVNKDPIFFSICDCKLARGTRQPVASSCRLLPGAPDAFPLLLPFPTLPSRPFLSFTLSSTPLLSFLLFLFPSLPPHILYSTTPFLSLPFSFPSTPRS